MALRIHTVLEPFGLATAIERTDAQVDELGSAHLPSRRRRMPVGTIVTSATASVHVGAVSWRHVPFA